MKISQRYRLAAFTLIEILVTVSLSAIIMLGVTSLFITFITVTGKARLSQNIRENGTVAMQKMIQELRNAREVGGGTFVCDGSTINTSVPFINADYVSSNVQANSNRILLTMGANTYYLTSNTNQLRDLHFVCYDTDVAKYIEISFTLASSTATTRSVTHSQLDFVSGVTLRN